MGEMLRDTERAKANQYTKSAELPQGTEQPPTLSDLGLTKKNPLGRHPTRTRKHRRTRTRGCYWMLFSGKAGRNNNWNPLRQALWDSGLEHGEASVLASAWACIYCP